MNIEERIRKLERNARLYRVGFILILAVLAAGILMGETSTAPVSEVVRCRGLVIEDTMGRARAIMQVTQEGVGLFMYDEQEKKSIKLGLLETGTGLVIYDPFGQERLQLDLYKSKPRFSMLDTTGTRRIGMAISEEGQGLSLYDSAGKVRSTLDGNELDIVDERGKTRTSVGIRGVGVADEYGRPRIILQLLEGGPRMRLFDKVGQEIFRAPPDSD